MKVLFVSGMEGDTRRYRCSHQQEQLGMLGVDTAFRESDDPRLLNDVLDYDVLVLHRVPYSRLIGVVVDISHLRGNPVVFDVDDLVFVPDVYERIGFVDTLRPEEARKFRRRLWLQAKTFECCDCALTATESLARKARDSGKPAFVNRNAPSNEMIAISEEAFAARCHRLDEKADEDAPLVLGYFSGTGSHNRDFQVITGPVLWVLETHPQAWLHIGGHLDLEPVFSRYRERIRRTPYVDWRELPHLIARVDINLAPLEKDNPFCQAKSENKFVEAALVGVPTIASRVNAFEHAITDGEDGLLASNPGEWKAALQLLLENASARRRMGEAARETVYARYMPEDRASGLSGIIACIIDRFGGAEAPAEEVLLEWAACMAHYAEQMQEDAVKRDNQIDSLRATLGEYESQLVETVKQKNKLIERRERLIGQKEEAIDLCRETIARKDQLIEQQARTIEGIMQGRVMRLVTSCDRLLRKMIGATRP